MKNQYFGDVNDYRKYGLLRAIHAVTGMKTLVAWMLTPDDGGSDGNITDYLEKSGQWIKYDPALYLWLQYTLKTSNERRVSLIEQSGILRNTSYFSDIIPDERNARQYWLNNLCAATEDSDLVFLDPDNGLEVKSKPYGSKDSSKYLYWQEVSLLWKSGKSLLMYQHFPRKKRDEYIQSMLASLTAHAKGAAVEAFSTPHVLFLLALQPSQAHYRQMIADYVENHWEGQIKTWKLNYCPEVTTTKQFSIPPQAKTVQTSGKICPECGHAFKGKSWEGIDAHWRAKHEHIMPYREAWELIKSGNYNLQR
ncbi:MAG: hypothetical protein U9N50_00040 [Pseudomonadota bacterium]|nr:hypothetical protein [Pseudomonadota bacterium]